MPRWTTEEELTESRARAVWAEANGRRRRAWWMRLWITPLGDALTGHVWPDSRHPPEPSDQERHQ